MDNIGFLTKNIEISEVQTNGNIIAKFCLCDFSVNGNGVKLNRDTVEDWMSSLVNQPLVGRIGYSGDFTGHNIRTTTITCADGEKRKTVVFDTEAIGTFTDVTIETEDETDYIVGTAEIWARYPMVCELIKKRVSEGTLHTSWEITVSESHIDDDVKVIDNGCFTALCVLGKNVAPAYDSSRMLEVAELYEDSEFSDALSVDFLNNSYKEVTKMDKNEKLESAVESEVLNKSAAAETEDNKENKTVKSADDDMVDDDEVDDDEDSLESSSLTVCDLRHKLECVLDKSGRHGYISYLFPEDRIFLFKTFEKHGELQYDQYTYEVTDDEVVISDPTPIELVATPMDMNKSIAEKTNALAKAGVRISELEAQLDELAIYKEAAEKAAAEKAAAELKEKQKKLKAYAIKSGFISEQECAENETIKTMISELNENGVKELIADRLVASLLDKEVEISTKDEPPSACMNLYDGKTDAVECDLVSAYINKKN